jgi:formylglycine-generating enzyme required for sulfatase activity
MLLPLLDQATFKITSLTLLCCALGACSPADGPAPKPGASEAADDAGASDGHDNGGHGSGGDGGSADGDSAGDGSADGGDGDTGALPTTPEGRPPRFAEARTGMALALIPASTFTMGCTPGQNYCSPPTYPASPVTLTRDYYMGVVEVTQETFYAYMGYTDPRFPGCPSCPVERITWYEAAALANALSAAEGVEPCYACAGASDSVVCEPMEDLLDCPGYRLPTEAEWEAAARCGEDTAYAGGDVLDEVAWHAENSGEQTHPVASLAPNTCGLLDMSGNVYEWANDWYADDYLVEAGRTDPMGAEPGLFRSMRGHSWKSNPLAVSVVARAPATPDAFYGYLGVRLARTAP